MARHTEASLPIKLFIEKVVSTSMEKDYDGKANRQLLLLGTITLCRRLFWEPAVEKSETFQLVVANSVPAA